MENPLFTRRPKAGLLLLTAEWFAKIGATGGSYSELPERLAGDAARIAAALAPEIDLVSPGVLSTLPQAAEAVERFQREDIDLLIACHITWGEDRLILEAVQRMPLAPLLLWCYSPLRRLPDPMTMSDLLRSSGPVGALQASGPLKRLGRRFGFAFGSSDDPQAIRRIIAYARAARVAKDLRKATIGVLPYRCDQMTGTYVDEFRLKKEIGPQLKYISTGDYRAICEAVPSARVEAFVRELEAAHPRAGNLTQAGLARGARVSLGLADLARQYALEAVAIEDVGEELHRVLGLRPCLSVPALFAQAVVSMEAEVGGAVALLAHKMLSGGKPPMYTEIFTYHEAENCLLMGHAGMQDARLAASPREILLEPDGEFVESEPDSAWMRFRARGGPVTLLSVFCDVERFKLVVARGEALGGPVRLLGSPHAYVKLTSPLAEFFEKAIRTGMTQHWALVHDDLVEEIAALAEILQVEMVLL